MEMYKGAILGGLASRRGRNESSRFGEIIWPLLITVFHSSGLVFTKELDGFGRSDIFWICFSPSKYPEVVLPNMFFLTVF